MYSAKEMVSFPLEHCIASPILNKEQNGMPCYNLTITRLA